VVVSNPMFWLLSMGQTMPVEDPLNRQSRTLAVPVPCCAAATRMDFFSRALHPFVTPSLSRG